MKHFFRKIRAGDCPSFVAEYPPAHAEAWPKVGFALFDGTSCFGLTMTNTDLFADLDALTPCHEKAGPKSPHPLLRENLLEAVMKNGTVGRTLVLGIARQ